ncbi:MAG: cell division protein FtsA [Candidatus Saccharimonas sp.]|jgi:cell division protein ftsA|nr:MAG: cell division protein FtsA [Candidatus Saccharimonas sp.]
MQEQSRYAVGIDVGTTMIRCVVGHIDPTTGTPTIVGVGQAPNSGMRKGTVSNLNGPAQAIDQALGDAERMSGYEVNAATISVNGSHIVSTKADGMIAVGMADHEVVEEDVLRLEDVATTGKVPANREILEVVPFSYTLDGQGGIKDPVGMTGTRLEINANVVSAMAPYVANLQKAVELATVKPHATIPSVMAAAKAVLNESQIENGVAVIDLGGATTSVAVFEEGDLQYVGVVPKGGVNITNDLAIGLKTDPEVAEKVKLQHAAAIARGEPHKVSIKHEKETLFFDQADVDEIVEARLEEIFELVNKELKKAGRAGQLPSGAVLTGGTANLKGMAEYAKSQLGVAVRIGKPHGFGGVADEIDKPHFAAAVGLMLVDADAATVRPHSSSMSKKSGGFIKSLLSKFKP